MGSIMESSANIYKDGNTYRVLLNTKATELLNVDEVCFDKTNLIIRIPTIYDNSRYRIHRTNAKNSTFVFTCYQELDIIGKYWIEKDGDDYYLVKKEKTKLHTNDQTNNSSRPKEKSQSY